jgi:hypothetical protein
MISGEKLLLSFASRGVRLRLKGANIEVSPRSLITEKMRAFICDNKQLLVAALRNNHPAQLVTCYDCAHFIPDPIGQGGVGNCSLGDGVWLEKYKPMPPYPHALRSCDQFGTIKYA